MPRARSMSRSWRPLRIGVFLSVGICLAVIAAGCGMWSNDIVEATVVFDSEDKGTTLSDVRVIVGSDKFHWPRLAAGQTDKVKLRPHADDDRQLTLLFRLNEQNKAWEGPKFGLGVGYRIVMTIDSRGGVTDRHCILPCDLD